jgi:Ca2+-binding RTX toxin-like protein
VAGNDVLWGELGDDYVQGGDGNDIDYGDDGNDDLDGGLGDDVLYDGAGNDHLSADEGNDTLYIGWGMDDAYGEPGGDTLYLLNDGVRDEVYCGPVTGGEPGDNLIYVGGMDKADHVNFCNVRPQVIPAGSPEYTALLPLFGTAPTTTP